MQNYWINWYVQDEWRPRDNLTLNYGVRYDIQYHSLQQPARPDGPARVSRQFIDPTSRGDNNNFGPRVGLVVGYAG